MREDISQALAKHSLKFPPLPRRAPIMVRVNAGCTRRVAETTLLATIELTKKTPTKSGIMNLWRLDNIMFIRREYERQDGERYENS